MKTLLDRLNPLFPSDYRFRNVYMLSTAAEDEAMYGGFEQVGSIGQSIPRNDKQMTTSAGDIVLYSGKNVKTR